MNYLKKLSALALAVVMVFALAVTANAQNVSPTDVANQGGGTITVENAAKGETYTLYRLFDAYISTATTAEGAAESIAYTGTIPAGLEAYFEIDDNGYITAKDAAWKDAATKAEIGEELKSALTQWAENVQEGTAVASVESDGTTLKFTNLKYGYYVLKSSEGTAISVDSTNPNATIVDKNSSTPSNLTKTVGDDNVNIGDTVTYTVKFETSDYYGAGEAAEKIVSYTITDTLPEFLKDVTVTSIVVDNDGDTTTTDDQKTITQQFTGKKIDIKWYDETTDTFLYDNGATITITYTAVVTDKAAIDGNGNENKVTLQWTTEGKTDPEPKELKSEETIFTYAIALKKVDQEGKALAGAVFEFPFYVQKTPDADGAYIYAGTSNGANLIKEITTPDTDGLIIVKGVAAGTYEITEVEAPNGYNKLANPVTIEAVKTGETTTNTTFYIDEQGNVVDQATTGTTTVTVEIANIAATAVVVVNKTGAELPSTGGMGTTIFYVVGSILLVGAVVLLVTKKRMGREE